MGRKSNQLGGFCPRTLSWTFFPCLGNWPQVIYIFISLSMNIHSFIYIEEVQCIITFSNPFFPSSLPSLLPPSREEIVIAVSPSPIIEQYIYLEVLMAKII